MLKITITVEDVKGTDERGFEKKDRVGEFSTYGEPEEIWEVYRNSVSALTPQPDTPPIDEAIT